MKYRTLKLTVSKLRKIQKKIIKYKNLELLLSELKKKSNRSKRLQRAKRIHRLKTKVSYHENMNHKVLCKLQIPKIKKIAKKFLNNMEKDRILELLLCKLKMLKWIGLKDLKIKWTNI